LKKLHEQAVVRHAKGKNPNAKLGYSPRQSAVANWKFSCKPG
jgi:hypothetical protein